MGGGKEIAKMTGFYRCTGLGCTAFVKTGEQIPSCSENEGDCCWEYLKEDNLGPGGTLIVFVGKGILLCFETDVLPDIGMEMNIRSALMNEVLNGKYRIVGIGVIKWSGEEYFHLQVERIGDVSVDLPIHNAVLMNC